MTVVDMRRYPQNSLERMSERERRLFEMKRNEAPVWWRRRVVALVVFLIAVAAALAALHFGY